MRDRRWECQRCGFVYDETEGLPDLGIPPGTRWDDLDADWTCPDCGAPRPDFAITPCD